MKSTSIKQWIIRYFVIVLVLSAILSSLTNFYENYVDFMQQREDTAVMCAKNVSNLLNHQWSLEELDTSLENETYQKAQDVMRQICTVYRLDYVYVYSIDTAEPSRYYYMCVAADDEKNEAAMRELSLRNRYAATISPGELAILNGARTPQRERIDNRFGDDVTWICPYVDRKGELRALIGMDYSATWVGANILQNFLLDIIPFVLFITISLVFLLFMIQRRIISPISILSNNMKQFSHNSLKQPEKMNIPPGDEIGEIAGSFEKMTEEISTYVNNIESLTREKLENDVQLSIARRIQNGLVPEKISLEGNGFCSYAMTHPAKAVGGDFYDCFIREDGRICAVIGDVSGKGISAAICMAMVKTVIREKLKAGLSPAEVLNRTNDEFCERNPGNLFATAFVAVLDPVSGELLYANAGHTYPVILSDDPKYLIPESGIALGMFEDANLTDNSLTLMPGQGILLYTDGVTEAVDDKKQFFGTKKLMDAVAAATKKSFPADEVVLAVGAAVDDHCKGMEPFDDRAVMALIRTKGRHRKLPVDKASFEQIKEDVFEIAKDTPDTRRALLACDEVLANIVDHSGATHLEYGCDIKEGLLRITFSDDGVAFDPTEEPAEEKEFDLLDTGGMGLSLILQSAVSTEYERKDGWNIFTLSFGAEVKNGQ